MIGAFGGVLYGRERDLASESMVELPRHSIAAGAPVLLGNHKAGSVCTSLKPYSAYTTSGDST